MNRATLSIIILVGTTAMFGCAAESSPVAEEEASDALSWFPETPCITGYITSVPGNGTVSGVLQNTCAPPYPAPALTGYIFGCDNLSSNQAATGSAAITPVPGVPGQYSFTYSIQPHRSSPSGYCLTLSASMIYIDPATGEYMFDGTDLGASTSFSSASGQLFTKVM